MKKNGFTLIEVIVSVVLVSVVMVSLLGSLIQIRQTYTLIHENSDVLVYSSSISRVINNDLINNNGIRYSTCNVEGTKCELILGNDERRELEIFTEEVELETEKNIRHDNIKTTLRFVNTTKYERKNNPTEEDKELIYIRTLELDKYTNLETNQITTNGYNFYDMNTSQYEHSSDDTFMIDVFTTIKIRMYDGINYDSSRYDVVLYTAGRYDYSSLVGKAYRIKLDNSGADTVGTSSIDELFGVGFYKSESVHNNSNLLKTISIPTKTVGSNSLAFLGYYYKPAGTSIETQVIDASGLIIASSRLFRNNVDLVDAASGLARVYAKWGECSDGFELKNGICSPKEYTVTLNKNGGTGGESSYTVGYQNKVKDLVGIPKKTGYRFVGYNSEVDDTGFHDSEGKGLVIYNYSVNTSLIAHYAKCTSGTYSNLNNNTCDACVAGSIASGDGLGSCMACQNGTTTTGNNRTLCDSDCSNKAHVDTWQPVTWNTDNTITEQCKITACKTGYRLTSNSCSAITYTITLNKNGGVGSQMANSTHTYDIPKNLLQNTYTRTGYTFQGWARTTGGEKEFDDKASVMNLTTTQSAQVYLYAVWKPNTYTVSYNSHGGSSCTNFNVTFAKPYGTLCTPTRTGYTFDGWYLESTYENKVVSTTNATTPGDHELHAKWIGNTYTATFNKNGATSIGKTSLQCTVSNTAGNCTVTAPSITRSGFTITGWNTSATATTGTAVNGTITLTADATYYAITSKDITITFNKNGNTSQTPKNGSASTADTVTQTCTIRNNNSTCNITSPTITHSGYTIIGYSTATGTHTSSWDQNTAKAVDTNATYYAQASKLLNATFTVKDPNACTASATSASCTVYNATTSCSVTAPTLTAKSGYTVDGWSTTNGGTTTTSTFTSGNTYYSVTHASTALTGTFNIQDTNAATKSGGTLSCYKYNGASSCNIVAPKLTAKSGTYTVIGWNTNSSATTSAVNSEATVAISANTTYYSITRTTNAITGTFNIQDSNAATKSGGTLSCYKYNGATSCSITAPTLTAKSGYTVVGWNTNSSATTSGLNSGASTSISSSTTYYSITYKDVSSTFSVQNSSACTSSGTSASCKIYNANTTCSITAPTLTAKTGYAIVGWNTSSSATTSSLNSGATGSISGGERYYSITKCATGYTGSNCHRCSGWLLSGSATPIANQAWYYYDENGNMLTNSWIYTKEGHYSGTCSAGTGTSYYWWVGDNGKMVTGWALIDGVHYYFEPNDLDGNGYINGNMYASVTVDLPWSGGTDTFTFDSNGHCVAGPGCE